MMNAVDSVAQHGDAVYAHAEGIARITFVVVVGIMSPYQATIVALFQSKVGLSVFHVSAIGTLFHLKACNE